MSWKKRRRTAMRRPIKTGISGLFLRNSKKMLQASPRKSKRWKRRSQQPSRHSSQPNKSSISFSRKNDKHKHIWSKVRLSFTDYNRHVFFFLVSRVNNVFELLLDQFQQFLYPPSYLWRVFLTLRVFVQSFEELDRKVALAELVLKEVSGKLVELIVEDGNEIHYQLLKVDFFGRLLYAQVGWLRIDEEIDELLPLR